MLEIRLHLSAFPQSDRMRLLAQEMIIQFLEPTKSRGRTQDDRETAVQILSAAYAEARKGPTLREENGSVDRHLAAMVSAAAKTCRTHIGKDLASRRFAAVLGMALTRMRKALRGHGCKDCEHDTLCGGIVLPDQRQVGAEPLCLKPLYALAKGTAQFTQVLYARCVPALTGCVDVDVRFVSEPEEAVRITGETTFAQPDVDVPRGASSSRVCIGLPLGKLDPDTYFPMVYAIAHELAVHTIQELLRTEPRGHPTHRVAFAEGLIDRVIYEELVHAIRNGAVFVPPIPTDALGPIEKYHATRKDVPGAQVTYWTQDLGFGRKAYEALLKLGLHAIRNSAAAGMQEALDWAHATALALNVMALSEDERHAIVEGLADLDVYFNEAGEAARPDRSEDSPLTRLVGALAEIQENLGPQARDRLLHAMQTI